VDDAVGAWRGERFVYSNPRQVFTTELLHDDDESEHYVLIIDGGANVRHSIETEPERGDWRLALGLDRSEFDSADDPYAEQTATLDERGGIKLLVRAALKPGRVRVRVLVHSWAKAG
jgi:hypothetical protein